MAGAVAENSGLRDRRCPIFDFSIERLDLSSDGISTPWPMHLCDWAAVTGGLALLTQRQFLIELTYFWAIAGGLNALLTPDVHEGFPHPRFVVFFIHHIAIVAVAVWMTVGMHRYPRKNAVWKVFGWTQLFVIAAMVINHFTGHNYGFLAFKPDIDHPLLDIIGPWPWYILSLELVTLIIFLILDLPWVFVRKFGRRATDA